MVHDATDFTKFTINHPAITGHKGPVQDICFSPFNDQVLASASSDNTLKLWILPDEGLKESTAKFDANLEGHNRKVMNF